MTTGRGATAADAVAVAAGLRFAPRRAAGLLRALFFFFAARFFPARLFAFAIDSSVVLEAPAQ